MYCHLHHSLTLKGGQNTTHSIIQFIPLPTQIWDGRHMYHVLVLPGYEQKMDPLVRSSSGLKFGCHGWLHRLSSPRSLLTRTEGQTITHFCTHSFHSRSPAWPLTRLCWSRAHCWPSSVEPPRLMNTFRVWSVKFWLAASSQRKLWWGSGARGVWETHMRKFNFCISEGLSKRLMQEAESQQAAP